MMKIAVMAIALVMGSFAFGQQEMKKEKATPEERAINLTNKMAKQLSLDGDQTSKIAEINLGIVKKNENIRNDANLTKEQKKEILLSNHNARLGMYKNVLTAEQYTKFEEMEKQRMERKEAHKADRKQTQTEQPAPEPEDEL